MFIKEIFIQNFKGFEKETFKFRSLFTVAIGNNAMGKSSLLHAIQVALGGYLQCLDIPGSKNNRRQFYRGEAFVKWSELEKSYVRNLDHTLVKTFARFSTPDREISWKRVLQKSNHTSHNRWDAGDLIDLVADILHRKSIERTMIPIVASFGTERTVAQLRKGKKAHSRRLRIEKGFLACLSEKVDFDGVIEWIHDYDEELTFQKEFEGTKQAFYEAIHQAIPYLKNVEYHSKSQEFRAEVIIDKNTIGKTAHSNMSDGLKAMLNLVAELAYRCVILNGFRGTAAVRETEGVVLIDELDMHLYPIWQRHVVDDLKRAFPKIQFIVTTHSPFIIQSVYEDELINLDNIRIEVNPKDQTINKIVTDVMGVDDINGDDFAFRHKTAIAVMEEIKNQKMELNQDDYVKLKKMIDGILMEDSDDPVYKAYLKVKNTK